MVMFSSPDSAHKINESKYHFTFLQFYFLPLFSAIKLTCLHNQYQKVKLKFISYNGTAGKQSFHLVYFLQQLKLK